LRLRREAPLPEETYSIHGQFDLKLGGAGSSGGALLTQVHAPVHELPSMKIVCDVAPAARMPSMAAWLRLKTSELSMSWYSLLVSKMTLLLLAKSLAVVVHQALKPFVSVMTCS
jgi:hypothetical protein